MVEKSEQYYLVSFLNNKAVLGDQKRTALLLQFQCIAVTNIISLWHEAVSKLVLSVWQISIFLYLSAPVLSSSTWWKTTATLALPLETNTSGRHMVHLAINHKHSEQWSAPFLRTSILWKSVSKLLLQKMDRNACWFYSFPLMFVGTTILFPFPFTVLFLSQTIPGKVV